MTGMWVSPTARSNAFGRCRPVAWLIESAMLIVKEETCREIIGREEAFTAVEAVFTAMARGEAYNFPVIREAIGHADALYGFKSGFDRAGLVLGVKSGEPQR